MNHIRSKTQENSSQQQSNIFLRKASRKLSKSPQHNIEQYNKQILQQQQEQQQYQQPNSPYKRNDRSKKSTAIIQGNYNKSQQQQQQTKRFSVLENMNFKSQQKKNSVLASYQMEDMPLEDYKSQSKQQQNTQKLLALIQKGKKNNQNLNKNNLKKIIPRESILNEKRRGNTSSDSSLDIYEKSNSRSQINDSTQQSPLKRTPNNSRKQSIVQIRSPNNSINNNHIIQTNLSPTYKKTTLLSTSKKIDQHYTPQTDFSQKKMDQKNLQVASLSDLPTLKEKSYIRVSNKSNNNDDVEKTKPQFSHKNFNNNNMANTTNPYQLDQYIFSKQTPIKKLNIAQKNFDSPATLHAFTSKNDLSDKSESDNGEEEEEDEQDNIFNIHENQKKRKQKIREKYRESRSARPSILNTFSGIQKPANKAIFASLISKSIEKNKSLNFLGGANIKSSNNNNTEPTFSNNGSNLFQRLDQRQNKILKNNQKSVKNLLDAQNLKEKNESFNDISQVLSDESNSYLDSSIQKKYQSEKRSVVHKQDQAPFSLNSLIPLVKGNNNDKNISKPTSLQTLSPISTSKPKKKQRKSIFHKQTNTFQTGSQKQIESVSPRKNEANLNTVPEIREPAQIQKKPLSLNEFIEVQKKSQKKEQNINKVTLNIEDQNDNNNMMSSSKRFAPSKILKSPVKKQSNPILPTPSKKITAPQYFDQVNSPVKIRKRKFKQKTIVGQENNNNNQQEQ